jgi:CRISPR-associated protein Csx17
MNDIISRRIMMAVRSGANCYPDDSVIKADLGDIAALIEDRVDLGRLMDLLWGLILVDWPSVPRKFIKRQFESETIFPSASYALLKLCFAGGPVCDVEVPLVPQIHRRASIGDGFGSMQLAERRLKGSNIPAAKISTNISSNLMKRIAAALLFSIDQSQIEHLASSVLRPRVVQE